MVRYIIRKRKVEKNNTNNNTNTAVSGAGRILSSGKRFLPEILPPEKIKVLTPMICYMLVYMVSFMLIEQWNRLHYTVIHTVVDDVIPFVPVFVIPYLLWFPYVTCAILFLLMVNEEAYHKLCTVLAIGMTVFIIVSVVFPNIHLLRPETMPVDNVFTRMVGMLYLADTPTNLTPSIHVFNSLAVVAAMWQWNWKTDTGKLYSARVRGFWRAVTTVLGLLITLSTMFIKQHSFSDVVIAFAFFLFTYILVYRFEFTFIGGRRRAPALRPLRTQQ